MIEPLFNQAGYLAAKRTLDAAALRHEAIASNIANIETPGYKRAELAASFQEELRHAIATGDTERLTTLQPRIEVDPRADTVSGDGNTVQLESELLDLQRNSLSHAITTQLLSGQLLKLQLAITGKTA